MAFFNGHLALIIALVLYGFIHMFQRSFHHIRGWLFLGSLILSTFVMFIEIPLIFSLIDSGHLSLSFFLLVMMAGVIPKRHIIYKKLLLVRGDLAILGFIFLLPHGIHRLSLALYGYNTSGLIAAIIMIPLTLSSFLVIRKKIRPDRWKALHKLAYLAYLMIYIHLGFDLSINPNHFYLDISPNSLLFHVFFMAYLVLKITSIIHKKKDSLRN